MVGTKTRLLLLGLLFYPVALRGQADRELARVADQMWKSRQWNQAERLYRELASRYPASLSAGRARIQIGVYLKYQGRWQEALGEYERVIGAFPHTRVAHDAKTGIAAIRYFRGDFAGAIDLWREVLAETADWDQIKYCSYMIRDARRRLARPGGGRATPCGPASLDTACRLLGVRTAPGEIRALLPAGPDGVSMEDMLRAAKAKGLSAHGVRLNFAQLRQVRKPAIAFVQPGHFVVVTGVDSHSVDYIDPALRNTTQRKSPEEFGRLWDGSTLIFAGARAAAVTSVLSEARMRALRGQVCWCCPPSGLGGNNPGAAYDHPHRQCGSGLPSLAVNMVNLNLLIQDLDFQYRGRGPAVFLVRTYNADDPQDGPFGPSWTFNYNVSLVENPNQTVDVRRETGRIDHYVPRADGTFAPPVPIYDKLTKETNGTYSLTLRGSRLIQQFNSEGKLSRIADRNDNAVTIGYDSNSRLNAVTDAANRVTRFQYGSNGKVSAVVDPAGRQATYEYDAFGNLVKTVDMAGNAATFAYDKACYITAVTTPRGTIRLEHEINSEGYSFGTLTDELGGIRAYGTYESDYRTRIVDANGHSAFFENTYDGQTGRFVDALGDATEYEFDDSGNLAKRTDAAGRSFAWEYDDRGNVNKITDALNNTSAMSYDAKDNLVNLTSRSNHETQYTYDPKGNLTEIIDPLGKLTTYGYDSSGGLIQITDANGNSTAFTYDGAGNLTRQTTSLGGTKTYTRDAVGRITSRTDASGNTIQLTYDGIDRYTSIAYPDGNTVRLSYGCCGPAMISDSNGTLAFEYDALGRLAKYTSVNRYAVAYTYDNAGNLLSLAYPNSGTVNYEYDDANRLVGVMDWLGHSTRYTYDPSGRLLSASTTKGAMAFYSWDEAGRPGSLFNFNFRGELIAGQTFERDAEGNISSFAVSAPVVPSVAPEQMSLTYDGDDRILSAGASTFQHDANGNLTQITDATSATSLAYDYANRLVKFASPGAEVEYQYDPLGNKSGQTANGVTTRYVVDPRPLNRLLAETDADGNPVAYYVYGVGLISKITPDGRAYFYCSDSLGNTVAVLDAAGSVANAYAYEPYGKVSEKSKETIPNPFRYAGGLGVIDENNGLLYMRARHYSVAAGRFVSPDPIGFAGGGNLYAYASGNPANWTDPSGLETPYRQCMNRCENHNDLSNLFEKGCHIVGELAAEMLELGPIGAIVVAGGSMWIGAETDCAEECGRESHCESWNEWCQEAEAQKLWQN